MLNKLNFFKKWTDKPHPKDASFAGKDFPLEIVTSFPKSGRTWLRVILDHLTVSLPYTHEDAAHNDKKHYEEISFDKSAFANSRVLLLVRDPRDVVTSSFFQTTRRTKVFEGDMSEFIQDPRFGILKYLTYLKSWEGNLLAPKSLLWISYEDLTHETEKTVRKVVDFFGREDISDEQIEEAVEFADFSNMQKMEREGALSKKYGKKLRPKDPNDKQSFKTREGKIGGHRVHMNKEDIAYCEEQMRKADSLFYPLTTKK